MAEEAFFGNNFKEDTLDLKHFSFVFSPFFFNMNYIMIVWAEESYTEECKEGKTVQWKAGLTKSWNQKFKTHCF